MKARWLLLGFCVVFGGGQLFAEVFPEAPVINSIFVVGTNLDFVATFPRGVARAILEMRPTLADEWQSAALLNVPADGGTIEFTIPKPALDTAFFRLNASAPATNTTPASLQFSTELQFVAVPPLGPDPENPNEAVFHFKGMIDGSDRIIISRQGALWEHVNWGWPAGAVTVNNVRWNPSEKNFMTTTGAVLFLPEKYSLESARLGLIEGRDAVALERTNAALIVYMDDTPVGAAPYEFKIHFPLATAQPRLIRASAIATLKIAAVIDGSDVLKITPHEAIWTHRDWSFPSRVRLNDVSWNVRQTNVLVNNGTNRFLPTGVDFSNARIVQRQGRDLATMRADKDVLWVNFADNPNGADAYELEISFGR
ncbi:MAG TPA: hypothetical protein VKA67_08015 [Verrucomicrobiae bacterium]|nr:hypothetical protein [Verrucomicrobiae bacterium]